MDIVALVFVQNEMAYLPQWLEYHLDLGFTRFLLYDNYSTDNPFELTKLYPVEYIKIPHGWRNKNPGLWARHEMLARLRGVDWFWNGSVDEYIRCVQDEKITDVLKDFEDTAALAVNWKLFTAGGKEKKEPGLVIERFTKFWHDPSRHIKTICKPNRVERWSSPHDVVPRDDWRAVNEKHEPFIGPFAPYFTGERIVIHHYYTMSREEYEVKCSKGMSDREGAEGVRRWDADPTWHASITNPVEDDDSLVKHGPRIREKLLIRYGLV
jgi:hypothetical protein